MISLKLKQWIASELSFDIQRIYVGLNNNIVLPNKGPYIVLQYQNNKELERPFYYADTSEISSLIGTAYQIDFYRAKDYAFRFYLLISSYNYPTWGNFINFLPPNNLTGISTEDRYLERFSVSVVISHKIIIENTTDMFTDVDSQLYINQ